MVSPIFRTAFAQFSHALRMFLSNGCNTCGKQHRKERLHHESKESCRCARATHWRQTNRPHHAHKATHRGCLPPNKISPQKHQRMDNPICKSPFTTVRLCRCPACFLVTSAAAPRWAQAGNTSGQLATVVIQVEGYTGALPTLVAGTDFTLGQPVGTNPAYMADESGKQPLAKLIESKEAQGFTLKWHDEAGKSSIG